MKKALNAVAWAVIVVLLACSLFCVLSLKEDLYVFGVKPMIMASSQLEPDIPQYSVCWVEKLDSDNRGELKEGDFITYDVVIDDEEINVCQQVGNITETDIETVAFDENISSNHIIRKTDADSRIFKIWGWTSPIIEKIATPIGIICLMGVIFVIVAWTLISSVFGKKKKKKAKRTEE